MNACIRPPISSSTVPHFQNEAQRANLYDENNNAANPLLSSPGSLFSSYIWAKTMLSVLHKELESKVEKLKYKKLEVMQLRKKNKSELPAGE